MVKQKFIQFFDVNTDPSNFSVFKVKAGGSIVHQRLAPFFSAYKYYKLGRVNVKCVPASTLPVDPTGLSYEAGENTVDPRDQFNPGLIRITNGEDLLDFSSFDMNKYYATMLDPRWYKFRLQGGFSRSAVPLVWNVAQNGQSIYPDGRMTIASPVEYPVNLYDAGGVSSNSTIDCPVHVYDADSRGIFSSSQPFVDEDLSPSEQEINPVVTGSSRDDIYSQQLYVSVPTGSSGGIGAINVADIHPPYMVQSSRIKLGWMPTDCGGMHERYYSEHPTLGRLITPHDGYAPIPEVDLMTFVFPKAFKTKYYYRIFVETTVYFKDPVVIDPFGSSTQMVTPIDRFVAPARITGFNYPGDGS